MHEHLSELALWQAMSQRRVARQYRGCVVRRAPLTARIIGHGLQTMGNRLTVIGKRLQGDGIAAPPGCPQPVER